MTKENYHHGDLRQAFIAQGIEILKELPAEKISYRELARRVKVSQTAPYRHFEDKDDFFASLAAEGFRKLSLAFQKNQSIHNDHAENFKKLGEAYIQFALSQPNLFRLMFSITSEQKKNHEELKHASDQSFQSLKEAVEIQADSNNLDQETRTMRAWALVHGLSSLIIDNQISMKNEDIYKIFV